MNLDAAARRAGAQTHTHTATEPLTQRVQRVSVLYKRVSHIVALAECSFCT
eukprot:m.65427 g.65427  ORF g.65427 m.65427 type:complete len:51 (-) comp15916_c0_seq4:1198-1350(-)